MSLTRFVGILTLALGAALAAAPASAGTLKVLHFFCRDAGCPDGGHPSGSLMMDSSKSLFGTTEIGGRNNAGVVFKMTYNSDKDGYFYHPIYQFCAATSCADGGHPIDSRLIQDTSGRLYGTASTGGTTPNGVVYVLTPNAGHTRYTQKVIYNFCAQFSDCSDGAMPVGGLTYAGASTGAAYDGTSPLYGVTRAGGLRNLGIVFSLTPNKNGTWSQKTLYYFCAQGGLDTCSDGKLPNADIVVDKNGNIVGTTEQGGLDNAGLVFKLTPTQQGHWAETLLYQFCQDDNCADGATPKSGVIIDSIGNIFGTTTAGGHVAHRCGKHNIGCGVLYKIATNGTESTYYNFCSQQPKCEDGWAPAGIMMDFSGNIFGFANGGGDDKSGVIFEKNDAYVVLDSTKCNDHACPQGKTYTGAPVESANGDLFGTRYESGRYEGAQGVVFQFTPTE
ncbi:MAG TPA: choice-of-anchor tandem repeat GloVer-containing protein [Rhizomicrobium sp.]|nr:choice-of-anchor tandem repeat GloVer-containing protein [Rhizomicrobium sp.]